MKNSMALYSHPHFSLRPEKKQVKDENGKLLRVTGDPYRLLELLCQQYPASITVTDINVAFDPAGAREYTEAHIRTMKNRIHTALGRDVITYQNHVYSLLEGVRKIESASVEGEDAVQKGPTALSIGKLQVLSVEQKPNFLRVMIQTPGGGTLVYSNDRYQGIM
jgi:hypothetical protein